MPLQLSQNWKFMFDWDHEQKENSKLKLLMQQEDLVVNSLLELL